MSVSVWRVFVSTGAELKSPGQAGGTDGRPGQLDSAGLPPLGGV